MSMHYCFDWNYRCSNKFRITLWISLKTKMEFIVIVRIKFEELGVAKRRLVLAFFARQI
jgi:hypothetical protein